MRTRGLAFLNDGSIRRALSAARRHRYSTLQEKVTALRKREGLTNDNKVIFDNYVLRGVPGDVLRSLWVEYLIDSGVSIPVKHQVIVRAPGRAPFGSEQHPCGG